MQGTRMLASVRRTWWVLVLTLLIGAGLGLLVTKLQTAEYTSTTELFVSTTGGTSSTESYQGNEFSQQRTASYAYLISSEVLAQRVVDELDLPISASEFASKVKATVVPRTVLLDIAVTDEDPQRAAQMANTLAAKFIEFAGPLETPVGQNEARTTITVVSTAEAASSPSSPVLTQSVILGLLGGLVAGLGYIALFAVFSRRIQGADDIDRFARLPGLGTVRVLQRGTETRHGQLTRWTTSEADDFRRLRGQLESGENAPRLLVITPVSAKEPAADFGVDLAATLAEAGRMTLLVGLTPDFATSASGLELGDGPGFAELCSQQARFDTVVRPTAGSHLYAMTAGATDVEATLSTPEAAKVFSSLRGSFERIVVVVAPVSDSSAASILAPIADSELLVVSPRAPRRQLQRAVQELRAVRAHLFGAVLVRR